MKIALRPYQEQGVADIRQRFSEGRKAVLYVLPTGGGKTVTYAHIAEQAGLRGNRVLILEHRKELIRQASLAAGGLGVHHSIIAPDSKVIDIRRSHVDRLGQPMIRNGANVSVASVQTLARRMEWLQRFDPALVIIDEAHHAVAGTWGRVIKALPRARLLGVTATPCRTDGQGLGDVFDCMVEGPTMAELIAGGSLVPPKIFAPPPKVDFKRMRRSKGDVRADDQAAAMDRKHITGDAVEHYKALAPHRPAIVFCVNVKHAENVAAAFRAAGFRFHVIHGGMDDGERDRLIYGLADGRVEGLVSVDVISEGTDLPVAEVAIMLRHTESESLYLQQAGRVLRPVYADGFDLTTDAGRLAAIAASDKQFGLILDHAGNYHTHGKPHDIREWTLNGRQKRPRKTEEEEREMEDTRCPMCYFTPVEGRECPECGHKLELKQFQPKQVDGTLQEVVETDAERQAREERIAARRAQGQARTKEQLIAQGKSEGQAEHIIRARQEKERMQGELRDLLVRWSKRTGRRVIDGWGFGVSDVRDMKPKALRQNIEAVSEALFLHGANDNEPPEQRRAAGE